MKGKETKARILIKPNMTEVTSDDVYYSLFKEDEDTAKALRKIAAKKPDHLHDSRYEELSKKFNINVNRYQYILRKMKDVGMIKKHGHVYYADRRFARFMRRFAMAEQEHCDDLGIPLKE